MTERTMLISYLLYGLFSAEKKGNVFQYLLARARGHSRLCSLNRNEPGHAIETRRNGFFDNEAISFPESAILLDCARNRELCARLKARQKNDQISLAVETCSFQVHFNHNLRRTRRIKPEPGFPGSGFGFDQSPCASRPLVKGTLALGTRLTMR